MALIMNYTYRIQPSVAQQKLMLSWLETCRRLYNRCLRDLKDWMNSRKCPIDRCSLSREYIMSPDIPFPGYIEQKRQLTQWKKRCDPASSHGARERAPRETDPYLKEVHSQVTQDVVSATTQFLGSFQAKRSRFSTV